MVCVNGKKECNACGTCMEYEPVMSDMNGIPIYEGEEYWEIDGDIYSIESLNLYRHLA